MRQKEFVIVLFMQKGPNVATCQVFTTQFCKKATSKKENTWKIALAV